MGAISTVTGTPESLSRRMVSRRRQFPVQGGDGYLHLGQSSPGEVRQKVQVPFDEGGFGGYGDRVPALLQDFQNLPGDAPLPLDGLVRVRVGAQGDGRRDVLLPRQFLA